VSFDALFVPGELRAAVSDEAWVEAMLEAERALANAEALAGVVPAHHAAAIADACRLECVDVAGVVEAGRSSGNPAEPLMRALREAVGGEAADWVHYGATSQDIVDSAAMLVARRALGLVAGVLDGVVAACAVLAREHRETPVAARTLLQQAVPTTFGFKAAGWLVAAAGARDRIRSLSFAGQLGGAAGTLAALGDRGLEVAGLYARELELSEPPLPWHTDRSRIAEIGFACALTAGVCAKIGLDVALLEQTEVGEVREPAGSGGSSTMPQKRNPVGSALAVACARRAAAASSVLTAALVQEHERALGAWQSEWGTLSDALAYAGGAAAAVREVLEGLEVDRDRMRANLDLTHGAVMSERLVFLLAPEVGRREAARIVSEAAASGSLAEVAGADALDPEGYLGSAAAFVDRALAEAGG
jgi:3-carboxy-cis,cis-muconate cycloisomerase